MNHVMIDIESTGTSIDAIVLSIGATKFNISDDNGITDSFYARLDIGEQLLLNRSVDETTIRWWNDQSSVAKNDAFKLTDRMSVSDALDGLSRFIGDATDIWAQGVTFDIVVLSSLYADVNKSILWKYNSIRDCRTILKLFGDNRTTTSHNALEDAISQTKALKSALKNKI